MTQGTDAAPLFREEVMRHRADRLHGSVSIATPLSWQLIGMVLAVVLIAVIVLLASASYARVETVPGTITLDKGVAAILPSRAGVVGRVLVAEGDRVAAGQRLVLIGADESAIDGQGASRRIRDALGRQDAGLADQTDLLLGAAAAEQQRLAAQIAGDRAIVASLGLQIADQRELIRAAEEDYRSAGEVAARGYISKRDMEQRRATILTRHQQLAQLQQSVSGKDGEIAQAERAMRQTGIAAAAQAAATRSSRAAVAQQQVQADLAGGYALKATSDGIVTALTVRAGQAVTPDTQLMMIIPPRARLSAELYAPTDAIGFVAAGQEVRLSIDAFGYQTYGTVPARIDRMSRATVARDTGVTGAGVTGAGMTGAGMTGAGATGAGATRSQPVYLVTATIDRPWIVAAGRRRPLLPGMTLSARIVTERRSLIEWLFQPLFAVRRR